MFVYQNKAGAVCITFQDNKPVEAPEYVLGVDEVAKTLTVNGTVIDPATETVESNQELTPAEPEEKDEPVTEEQVTDSTEE